MKTLTLILALTLPIIWGLDLTFCNIMIAVAIWAIEVIKWMNDKELQLVCDLSIRHNLQCDVL